MAFRALLCTSMALSKKEAFDSCTLPFLLLLICNQITGWCFPFILILSKHYDLPSTIRLLFGKLIDLSYLKRTSKINSNVTYPSFPYFISPCSDFHRIKTHFYNCTPEHPATPVTHNKKCRWLRVTKKTPFCFQLLCHYLKSLATREHNSILK